MSTPIPSSAAAALLFAQRHCASKGRYLVASRDIDAGTTLWQERPVIVCSSMDAAAAPAAVHADSPEECAFAALLPSLPSQLSASDLLLALHAVRRLRLFGRRSRVWFLLEQLQSKPEEPDAEAEADTPPPPPLSRIQQRFKTLPLAAQQIFDAWQQQIKAAAVTPAAVDAVYAVPIDAQLIERFLGALQLNAHRIAPLVPATVADAAVASSSASTYAASSRSGKALSLQLSMLEHDCTPNLEFVTEWSAAADDAGADADEQLVSIGVHASQLLLASSSSFSFFSPSFSSVRSSSLQAGCCSRSSLMLSLRAVRSIGSGEALSINYYPCRVRRAVRQAHLRALYGFSCRCSTCSGGRDRSRSFQCCFPAASTAAAASAVSVQDSPASASAARCAGIVSPVGLGQRFDDFSCDTCHRAFTCELQYQQLMQVEQAMRRGDDAAAFNGDIKPHHTHYLQAQRSKLAMPTDS